MRFPTYAGGGARVVLLALGLATVIGLAIRAGAADPTSSPPPRAVLAAQRTKFLQLAQDGIRKVDRYWWNRRAGWYDERLRRHDGQGTIWSTVHVFDTLIGIARAAPTPANLRALRRFADRSNRTYWNPLAARVGGAYVGGYAPRSKEIEPGGHVFFDDDGWLGLAYLDAYGLTHLQRYFMYADRAFQFTAKTGWADSIGGGVWWDTRRKLRTAESLTTNTLLGARLYELTRNPSYLETVLRYISWADANIRDRRTRLYRRDRRLPELMRYVQSPMIAAFESLCRSTGDRRWCAKAERLASDVMRWFPVAANHGPQYDAMFLRWMLDLYERDHNPRWYLLAYYNARRALTHARTRDGLFLRAWNGRRAPDAPPDSLKFEGATLSVFAWLAAERPPSG